MPIFTVSTVLDTPERVGAFVESNLRSGADHMLVFLDEDSPEVRRKLEGHPHVTVTVTDGAYWQGARPDSLNMRQRVNANLGRILLTATVPGSWLFHIDADECLDISREHLEALGRDVDVVTLGVHEAVSADEDRPHGLYKRLLGPQELALLAALGHVEVPTNRAYFRGYVSGKSGIRVGWDRALRTHDVVDAGGDEVEGHRDPALNVLHDESVTPAQFVAKWLRFSRTTATFRQARELTWSAVAAVIDNPLLQEADRERLLAEIYRRRVADPVDLLRELGYVSPPDPARHAYAPRGLAAEQVADLVVLRDALVPGPMDRFLPRRTAAEQQARLAEAGKRLVRSRPDMARRIRAATGR